MNHHSPEPLESRIAPATFTVSVTADSGVGSFRQAILAANASPDANDLIIFDFAPGSYSVISPLTPLPVIFGPVGIDATIAGPDSQLPHVTLDGLSAGVSTVGLSISGSGVVVQRLVISNFSSHGILIRGSNNQIINNYIGTDAAGTLDAGNGGDGVLIESGSGNAVGTLLAPNLISGNTGSGVHLALSSTATTVYGNRIGVNILSNNTIPNLNGVLIDGNSAANIVDSNLISGNTDYGIKVSSTAFGNTSSPSQFIRSNFIGTGASGLGDYGNGKSGVFLSSSLGVRVGEPRNIISGNGTHGVEIDSGNRHQIYNNWIGLDSTGEVALQNGGSGVYVIDSDLNLIGSQTSGNVISGNGANGVYFLAGCDSSQVLGNYIGTNVAGTAAVGNVGDGVRLQSANQVTIGGAGTGAGNVISGNGGDGIFVAGSSSTFVATLRQNLIGTTASGTGDLGNVGNGVHFSNVTGTATIGGSGSSAGNVIAGNGLSGILIGTASATTIHGNVIGRSDAPNARGILINTPTAGDVIIGGISPGQGNNIGFNTGAGVALTGSADATIRGNSLHDNGGLGIDLGNNGVTANDVGDTDLGPNGFLNTPQITTAVRTMAGTVISGTYAGLANTTLAIDFYSNGATGQAETYVGTATITTNAFGDASFSQTIAGISATRTISATATRTLSPAQTSENSPLVIQKPGLTVSDVTLAEGSTGTTNFVFTLTLGAVAMADVTVNFATADGTAVAGTDYVTTSGTATFLAGQTSITVTVPVVGDSVIEPSENFFLNLSNAVGATLLDSQGLGTITDDDFAGIVVNDVTVTEGNSGTTLLVFTVSLSEPALLPVSVDYNTSDDTALAGLDYTATSGTLTIPAGQLSGQISVSITGENLVEISERFHLNLSNANGANIGDAQGIGTIANDDSTTASISGTNITEGNAGLSNAVFTVTLSSPSASDVTFNFTTRDGTAKAGSDFTAMSGSRTIPAGSLSLQISVPVVGDTLLSDDETFFLDLANIVGATAGISSAQTLIVNDDDAVTLTLADASLIEGHSGSQLLTFTVQLSGALEADILIPFFAESGTATVGTDFTDTLGNVIIARGATTANIRVEVLGDTLPETNETFALRLGTIVGAPTNFTVLRASANGTITNDDNGVSISGGSFAESSQYQLTFSLSAPANQIITVDYATRADTATVGTDFTSRSGTVTFLPGATHATLVFPFITDSTQELTERFFVDLSNGSVAIGTGTAQITILDDDAPTVSIISANPLLNLEDGPDDAGRMPFIVFLSKAPTFPVTVRVKTTQGDATAADFVGIDQVITFAPGETIFESEVVIIADRFAEANERLTVGLSAATNATLGTDTLNLTILDNDGLRISKDRKTAIWRDLDGDTVSLKVTKPVLTAAMFTFRFGAPIAAQPELAGQLLESFDLSSAVFTADKTSINIKAARKNGLGDRLVNVGAIEARGINLGSVTVAGDLGKIEAGDLRGTGLKSLTIRSLGAFGTTTQSPGGDLVSTVKGNLGALKINGDFADATLRVERGLLTDGNLKSVSIEGSLRGGEGEGIFADGRMGKVFIRHDILGESSANPVSITAGGKRLATATTLVAISGLTVGGQVSNAEVLAGFDIAGAAVNPNASIGAVKVKQGWTASTLAAGISPGNDGLFGTFDDQRISGSASPLISRIASIVIGGDVRGTSGSGDHFGFISGIIGRMRIEGIAVPLTSNPNAIAVGSTNDVTVRDLVVTPPPVVVI